MPVVSVAQVTSSAEGGGMSLVATGDWSVSGLGKVDSQLSAIKYDDAKSVSFDTSGVSAFDTGGAWLVERVRRRAEELGIPFTHIDGSDTRNELVDVVRTYEPAGHLPPRKAEFGPIYGTLNSIGLFMAGLWKDFLAGCNVIGAAIRGPQLKAVQRRGIRLTSIIHHLDHMCLRAFPVIAVMSMLIGAVIAQQGALQLKYFGEELLTVNLVGILHLREIGALLTAVMVSGRTGSAITAEIGTMKMRDEIDALRVIGLNPIAVLILPRLDAIIIAVPILALLADLTGLFGAMIVSWFYIDIPPGQFITVLNSAIDLSTVFAGLIKAPFMALAIGLIAAIDGLKVSGSAESLGLHTTNAVVRSIFAVILIDGLFAIFYGAIDY